ncbi:hypothetical protein VUR80DRAFT_5976 [Thermomyces stellatus]
MSSAVCGGSCQGRGWVAPRDVAGEVTPRSFENTISLAGRGGRDLSRAAAQYGNSYSEFTLGSRYPHDVDPRARANPPYNLAREYLSRPPSKTQVNCGEPIDESPLDPASAPQPRSSEIRGSPSAHSPLSPRRFEGPHKRRGQTGFGFTALLEVESRTSKVIRGERFCFWPVAPFTGNLRLAFPSKTHKTSSGLNETLLYLSLVP